MKNTLITLIILGLVVVFGIVFSEGENNLEGVKVLIDNCYRMGSENNNVRMATVDPSIWLGQFLDKHWSKISYVTSMPTFNIMKVEGNQIVTKNYNCLTKEFVTDDEINNLISLDIDQYGIKLITEILDNYPQLLNSISEKI